MKRRRKPWSVADVAHLSARYSDTKTALIAAALARPLSAVYAKAASLGLRKTPEYLASPAACRLRRGDAIGAAFRFRPGQPAWNKGQRFEAGGRSVETRFKPGNKPQTWVPVGSYRVNSDGYLDRKVTDTGYPPRDWIGVHRLVWTAANGPLPDGHIVVFRPGRRTVNLDAITLDALECISRSELMARNSVHRLPKALADVVQLRGAIQRQINRRTRA